MEENKEAKGRKNIETPREKNEETKFRAHFELLTFVTDISQLFHKLYDWETWILTADQWSGMFSFIKQSGNSPKSNVLAWIMTIKKPVNILLIIVPQTVTLYIKSVITMLMSGVMINTEWVSSFF